MIDCAFRGHSCRADICQGTATSFFRTAKGTLWPLCPACSDRHKDISVSMVKDRKLAVVPIAEATFDIPLDDPEALAAWRVQDPRRVSDMIQAVDDLHTEVGRQFARNRQCS
jgi:hypothetical protein